MKKVFYILLLYIPLVMLVSCGSSPKAPAQSSEPLKATVSPQTNNVVIGTLPSGLTLHTLPAEYRIEIERAVTEEEWVEYKVGPIEYKWVEGKVEGAEISYPLHRPSTKTHTETYLYQEASIELVTLPEIYGEAGALIKPATVIQRIIPAIYKNLDRKTRISVGPAIERIVPYEYKNGKTRVPLSPPKTTEKNYPAVIKQIEVKKLARPPTYIIRDEGGQIVHRFETGTEVVDFLRSSKTP